MRQCRDCAACTERDNGTAWCRKHERYICGWWLACEELETEEVDVEVFEPACPYFTSSNAERVRRDGKRVSDNGKPRTVVCEGGRVRGPDKRAQTEYERQHCRSVTGWKRCTIAQMMDDYYERSL